MLWYLRGVVDVGLVFDKTSGLDGYVVRFVDSDYACDYDNRRSLTSYVFTITSCIVSWKATLQDIVSLSTTEVKYKIVIEVVNEAIWLRNLLGE